MALTVIGGTLKGRRLFSPTGMAIRPTSGRVREALFNIFMHETPGATVLDLFAGTGALAIEALSRGAARAVLIDNTPAALAVIQKNIHACELQSSARAIRHDAAQNLACLPSLGMTFDLVFMDPPYKSGAIGQVLENLRVSQTLLPGAWVVAEHSRKTTAEAAACDGRDFSLTDQRKYGKTVVSFFQYMVETPMNSDTPPFHHTHDAG
ncbi:16S rRNA (guanine(966)-N(2))-methyltransferase RsmD [Desulfosudis oleivorans]|uniref:Putative methyltransferase n=1 Tax=Desulfosudis oleivorans (strain DSM 6200 / JCM 39069 / Hxd3) TaxID=96561 RepID=A8ZXR6_DESOH|nr:16S rRNA (guanine(966)-N(2))-methyltransferase RsmD [Desulfosudis oleivorans]ABW68543.1 putative methyltransferase [Desulfosudis oleivorans Hxd3]